MITHQYVIQRSGDGREDVHTLGGEIPSGLCPLAFPVRPTSFHDVIPVFILQDDEISFPETEERRPFTFVEEQSERESVKYTEKLRFDWLPGLV